MLGGEERSAAERVARERIALESGGVGGTAQAATEPQFGQLYKLFRSAFVCVRWDGGRDPGNR